MQVSWPGVFGRFNHLPPALLQHSVCGGDEAGHEVERRLLLFRERWEGLESQGVVGQALHDVEEWEKAVGPNEFV